MQDHRKLKAFDAADRPALEVYRCTRGFPRDEAFGLTSQLRRAAVSIASNIVEGCTRNGTDDYIRFLEIAFGSAQEVEYQLSLARRLGYLQQEAEPSLAESLAGENCRILNALLRSLRQARTRGNDP